MRCNVCGNIVPDNVDWCNICGNYIGGQTRMPGMPQRLDVQPQGQGMPPQRIGMPPQRIGMPPQGQGMPPQGMGMPPQGQGMLPQKPQKPKKSSNSKVGLIIGISAIICVVLAVVCTLLFVLLRRPQSTADQKTITEREADVTSRETTVPDTGEVSTASEEEIQAGGDEYTPVMITGVSAQKFPLIEVTVGGHEKVEKDKLTVKEDGQEVEIKDVKDDGESRIVVYMANDISATGAKRTFEVLDDGEAVDVKSGVEAAYTEPQRSSAEIEIESCDATNYPEMTMYVTVEDGDEVISGLSEANFYIKEKISSGEYIYREVSKSEMLDGNDALNISMIVDKSGSMLETDMDKIKMVLTSFVDILQYDAGDKAEVIAVDDIARQMCTFTNVSSNLKNGIGSMYPEGGTALYDGMFQALQHVSYQNGARCVIAFTDGMDTASGHTDSEVIREAQMLEIPIYIIGAVDSSDSASSLRNIADSTGGYYWDINDIDDSSDIYSKIYGIQKDMYKVVYTCDESVEKDSERTITISMISDSYCVSREDTLTPVVVDMFEVNKTHTSRYEFVKADCTWEEANEACNQKGGHLVTITSDEEMDTVTALAQSNDASYVWLGGYTSYDSSGNVFGHWVTGEEFSYQRWYEGEPSRTDEDGEPEWYIMLWDVQQDGNWSWNDQRNDPLSIEGIDYFNGNIGYVIEYEY